MRVRFIGEQRRVNSFGTFEPGKVYDVSTEVGEQLITAPELFRLEESGTRRAATADKQIVDVTSDVEDKYKVYNIKELRAIIRERGLTTRRGARRAELVQLLEENDKVSENDNP